MYDLIIVGAGPAGTAAAVYAARQRLNLLVITKDVGGQVSKKTVDIENYPGFEKISGMDLAKLFQEQLEKNKVEIVLDDVSKIRKEDNKFVVSTDSGKDYESLTVIVATGADPRPLEVPGEKEFIGKGVSYCALCDGPIFRDKTVAVIGGGNSGFETALFLSNYVKKIYIFEFGATPKADEKNQELVKKAGKSEVVTKAKVLKIEGETLVKSLTYQDMEKNAEKKLDLDGVFVEIGHSPATAFVKDLVDFSPKDEILTERETYKTKTDGLFAAGDCNEGKYKQIITAAGEGAKAALAVYEYLQNIK
jgi:thioredoxin-disulfide reductase